MSECEEWKFWSKVESLAFDKNKNEIAVGEVGEIKLCDSISGTGKMIVNNIVRNAPISAMFYTQNGILIYISEAGEIDMHPLPSLQRWIWPRMTNMHRVRGICNLVHNPDGYVEDEKTCIVVGEEDGHISLIEKSMGKCIARYKEHQKQVNTVVSLGIRKFASGAQDGTIGIWEISSTLDEKYVQKLTVIHSVHCLSLSIDKQYLAAGCNNGIVILYQTSNWMKKWVVRVHNEITKNPITALAWDVYNRFIISNSPDNTIKILSVDTGSITRTLFGHTHWITSIVTDTDGTRIFSGSWDKTVRVWHIFSKMEKRIQSLFIALEIADDDHWMREVYQFIIQRTRRLWEIDA